MNKIVCFILLMVAFALVKIAVISLVIAYLFWKIAVAIFSRPMTPEELAQHEETLRISKIKASADVYYRIYKESTFIPKSKWIMMSRAEKSCVYEKRETMTERFNEMNAESQAFFIRNFGFDPR